MRRVLLGMLWVIALCLGAASASDWPHADDIPRPSAPYTGLAGQEPPQAARFFLAGGVRLWPQPAAAISPDGREIAFISEASGLAELWLLDDLGRERRVTFGAEPLNVHWTAQGLAYETDTGGDELTALRLITRDGLSERVLAPKAGFWRNFGSELVAPDGRTIVFAANPRQDDRLDLFALDMATGQVREIWRNATPEWFSPRAWRPDGGAFLVSRQVDEYSTELLLFDLKVRQMRSLSGRAGDARHASAVWAPDGRALYLATDAGRDRMALARFDIARRSLEVLAAPDDADVVEVALADDGRTLLWVEDHGGFKRLLARDLTTGQGRATPALPNHVGHISVLPAAEAPVVALVVDDPRNPGEVWRWDLGSNNVRRMLASRHAGIDLSRRIVPERVTFPARDGVTLNGLLYLPPQAADGGKVPVYLELHGGPTYHALPVYRPEVQLILSRGIAVLDVNYRGSTGSGRRFAALNDRRLRPAEVDDVEDAAAFLAAHPRIDGARMAVGGASYGGYLTQAIIARRPDLFAAAAPSVPVADWVSALEEAPAFLRGSDLIEFGDVRDPADRAFFAGLSPQTQVARVRTPQLMQVGANDPRSPIAQNDRWVAAVRANNVEVRYLRFADEGHFLTKPANQVYYAEALADFLVERLGPNAAGDTP